MLPALHIRIAPRNTAHEQILYTEGVQAHWRETTVGEHGELVLEDLPFEPGQPVEVLVVSKTTGSTTAGGGEAFEIRLLSSMSRSSLLPANADSPVTRRARRLQTRRSLPTCAIFGTIKFVRPLQEAAGVLLRIRTRQPARTGVGPWAFVGGSQTRRPGHSEGRIRLAARHALLSQSRQRPVGSAKRPD